MSMMKYLSFVLVAAAACGESSSGDAPSGNSAGNFAGVSTSPDSSLNSFGVGDAGGIGTSTNAGDAGVPSGTTQPLAPGAPSSAGMSAPGVAIVDAGGMAPSDAGAVAVAAAAAAAAAVADAGGGIVHGSGSCCEEHATPGCGNADLEVCVCEKDPSCCGTAWGKQCVFIVEQKYCQPNVRECVCGSGAGQWGQDQCCSTEWSSTCDTVAKSKCNAVPGCF
ncbi:MAG: hypothetical protein RL385_1416 [Pseudomonadota bacterium]|jgi:hypothetical protein